MVGLSDRFCLSVCPVRNGLSDDLHGFIKRLLNPTVALKFNFNPDTTALVQYNSNATAFLTVSGN